MSHDLFDRERLRGFLAAPEIVDRDLLRQAIEAGIQVAQASHFLPRSLKYYAYLLAIKKDPNDVPLLWRAKAANEDSMATIDVQLLVTSGIEAAKDALRREGEERGVSYLEECEKGGDFDHLKEKIDAYRFFLEDDLDEE